jgi:Family of unknown function (DUF6176)
MSEARLIKYRFKPAGEERWRQWSAAMKRRSDEVFATLRNEGVIVEACFLSREEGAIYYFVAAEDLGRAEEAARRSGHVIDREHTEVKATVLEAGAPLECLFLFDNSRG